LGADGVLRGNIIIRGGGDPTLGSDKMGDKAFLDKWASAIQAVGIKSIQGAVVADARIFDREAQNPKWIWEDLGNYYSPGVHGISYLDNTLRVFFRSGRIGSTPEIVRYTPEVEGMQFDVQLKSTSIGYDSAYFYGPAFVNYRSVHGAIPANRNEFLVRADLPNPSLTLAQHLRTRLVSRGIDVRDVPTDNVALIGAQSQTIHKHLSVPLIEVINETNIKSNNHYAEYLFRYLGANNGNEGTTARSIRAINAFWRLRGLPVDQMFVSDGSGLSPTNGVSANFFVDLLVYMDKRSRHSAAFRNSLAVAGKTGTLSSFLKDTTLDSKVYAKSGTLSRVKSYAGYIENNGKRYAFAVIVNNPNGSSAAVTKRIADFLVEVGK
jgi:serine-type D-Ala-D-Ala carboxypeptidase/endopeptidase (penicillin-binding protein 4)